MAGLWLHLGDNLTKAQSPHVAFDRVLAPSDPLALEGCRVLALRREQSVGLECLRLEATATPQAHLEW